MTQTEIEVTLKDHENQIKSLKHRMNKAEENDKVLTEILLNVKELAINMSHMVETQKQQDEYIQKQDTRIERLEKEPADEHKYYKRLVIGCVVTSIISLLVGAAVTALMNGGVS